jgi:catechol 2,3-dioxygenase-like lactoylglutathione lyase family enzyme
MIDHISLKVRDFDKAVQFFKAALAPLGYRAMMEFPGAAGFGDTRPDFWVMQAEHAAPTHIAFAADRPTVDAFYQAALAAGGRDYGPPGLRADYHPNYYGAFVLDPEGNNIEAVCHDPPGAKKTTARKAPAKRAAKKKAPAKRVAKKKAPAKRAAKKKAPAKKAAKKR